MRVLVCGLGRIAQQLLELLGGAWKVTVIDINPAVLETASENYSAVGSTLAGDASSPVVLENAGLSGFDYVLAMTRNDDVNLAVMRFAREKDVDYPLALVNSHARIGDFTRLGVRTVSSSGILAKSVYHYLQDPRIKVMPLDLGRAELMEMDVSNYFSVAGKSVKDLKQSEWRLVGMFRGEKFIFPDESVAVQPSDRLIILGREGMFTEVCDLMECGRPQFPHNMGQSLLLALDPEDQPEFIIQEVQHLMLNILLKRAGVVYYSGQSTIKENLSKWSEDLPLRYLPQKERDYLARLDKIVQVEMPAMIVMSPPRASFLQYFGHTKYLSLCATTQRPILFVRGTFPYKRIIFLFSHCRNAEQVLHVAVDMGKQFEAEVFGLVLEEKKIIKGGDQSTSSSALLENMREMAHVLKFDVREKTKTGNPVRQAIAAVDGYDLLILGFPPKTEKFFLAPNIPELIASRVGCSVLLVGDET